MPYAWAGAARGLSEGIMAAMERRLRMEQMEQERQWREQQLELQREASGPVDLTQLFHMAGVPTEHPVLLPREAVGPVVGAAAGRLFSDPKPQSAVVTQDIADYYRLPPGAVGQPLDVWRHLMEAPSPKSALVDLGRFDPTLAGIEVTASDVLSNLNRLRPGMDWDAQAITPEIAQAVGMPELAGQPMGALSTIGGFMRDVASAAHTREETSLLRPRTEAEMQRALAAAGVDEARRAELEATLPHTIENLQANTALTQALRDLRVQEGLTEEQMRDATVRRIDAEIGRMDAETARTWAMLPYEVKKVIADTLRTQAETLRLQADTSYRQLESDLLERWGDLERETAVEARQVATERDRFALERERQLLEPIVRKAIAEADVAERTVDGLVRRVNQEIENLYLQGQLSQEELRRAREMTPLIVQEQEERIAVMQVDRAQAEHELDVSKRYAAREREANINRILADTAKTRVDTEIARVDHQYLEVTLADRVAASMQQQQLLRHQIDLVYTEYQQAQVELAMARRLGGYREQEASLRVQQLEGQIAQLQLQNQMLEIEAQQLQSIDPREPDALLRLYEADSRQFRDAGMWVPPYQDYVEFIRSGGGDWAAEVAAYNEAATELLGPARVDDERAMTAKDHMQLARAMYEARYWLGGKGTPTFEEFLWTEYWPSYESMQFLLNPEAYGTGDYEFDPVLEATLFLGTVDDDVDEAIRVMEENMEQLIQSGSLTQEQAEEVLEVLRREKEARGGSSAEEAGFLRRIWNWLTRRGG